MARTKQSQSDTPAAVYVIAGKDGFLVGRQCDRLLDRLLPEEQRGMALHQPRPEDAQVAEVLDELRTPPFLADRRVVLMKDADTFISNSRAQLEKYLDAPSSCGVLIMTARSCAKNTRLAKALLKVGGLIDVEEIKGWKLPDYAAETARTEYGKVLSKSTAKLLVELAGDDPGRVHSEVEKLAMYVGQRKEIAAADVEALIGHNRMFNAFAVIDAMTAGDMATALARLRSMFASDKSAEYTVVGAFAFHFRKMFCAKVLMDRGMRANQIASQLRVFGDRDGFFRQVSRVSLERIGRILCELARMDHGIKTGRTTGPAAMEQLLIELSAQWRS